MFYLIALFAVLFLGLYDYLHDKATWTLKANILKYIGCLAAAWLYVTISSLGIFRYLEIGGIVVLAGMFTGIVQKWLLAGWTWIKGLTAKK